MATGICYTQSGTEKRYEEGPDDFSITYWVSPNNYPGIIKMGKITDISATISPDQFNPNLEKKWQCSYTYYNNDNNSYSLINKINSLLFYSIRIDKDSYPLTGYESSMSYTNGADINGNVYPNFYQAYVNGGFDYVYTALSNIIFNQNLGSPNLAVSTYYKGKTKNFVFWEKPKYYIALWMLSVSEDINRFDDGFICSIIHTKLSDEGDTKNYLFKEVKITGVECPSTGGKQITKFESTLDYINDIDIVKIEEVKWDNTISLEYQNIDIMSYKYDADSRTFKINLKWSKGDIPTIKIKLVITADLFTLDTAYNNEHIHSLIVNYNNKNYNIYLNPYSGPIEYIIEVKVTEINNDIFSIVSMSSDAVINSIGNTKNIGSLGNGYYIKINNKRKNNNISEGYILEYEVGKKSTTININICKNPNIQIESIFNPYTVTISSLEGTMTYKKFINESNETSDFYNKYYFKSSDTQKINNIKYNKFGYDIFGDFVFDDEEPPTNATIRFRKEDKYPGFFPMFNESDIYDSLSIIEFGNINRGDPYGMTPGTERFTWSLGKNVILSSDFNISKFDLDIIIHVTDYMGNETNENDIHIKGNSKSILNIDLK